MRFAAVSIVIFAAAGSLVCRADDAAPSAASSPGRAGEAPSKRVLRVAADPSNLPYSNRSGEGFENELATIIGRELNAEVEYVWRAQRRGFFRETLGQKSCDVVMGVPTRSTECLTTQPYYRSTYVWLTRRADEPVATSIGQLQKSDSRIGIQLLGDGAISPPAHVLIEKGLNDRLAAYSLYAERPAELPGLVRAVRDREIDLAVAWGPVAGSFARQPELGLSTTPLKAEEFRVSGSVRHLARRAAWENSVAG